MFKDESGKTSPTKVIAAYLAVFVLTPLIFIGTKADPSTKTYILNSLGVVCTLIGALFGSAQARTAAVLRKRATITIDKKES